jgi:hypothetical protein
MKLLQEFNSMRLEPIFEVNLRDYLDLEQDEWVYSYITADEKGLTISGEFLKWDEDFSLDEHLQKLLDMYINSEIRNYMKSVK